MISVVVLTRNEEKDIEDCLKSLDWVDEIVVVDDYSTDKTLKIAKNYQAKIFSLKLQEDFSKQRNFGLEKATNEWVLFVDADERVSQELAAEIKNAVKNENIEGFYLKRKDYFLGRWLKFGETSNVKLLRLAKKGTGRWRRRVHEIWEVKGRTEELNKPLWHYSHPDLSEFLDKINRNTSIDAKFYFEQGKKFSLLELIFFPVIKFLKNYFFYLGFLDGMAGLIIAGVMSFNSFLIRAKLMELEKGLNNEDRH